MAAVHFIRWSINLFNLHLGLRRIQQRPIRHKPNCLRRAYVDVRGIHSVNKEMNMREI